MIAIRRAFFLLALIPAAALAQIQTGDASRLLPATKLEGQPVIDPRSLALTGSPVISGSLEPKITITPVGQTGLDIVYTYTNTTSSPKPLSRIVIGTLAMGPEVQYLNVFRGSTLSSAKHADYIGQAWRYPSEAYSPVTAIMNDKIAVGVSLIYPILEYKHDVLVGVNKGGGVFNGPKGQEGWYVSFDLSTPPYPNPNITLAHPASLAPGESRSYTVAVRWMKRTRLPTSPTDTQDWLETLLPYREAFQKSFGPVSYTRNPDPVLARELANISAISPTNPRGLLGDRTTRPDLAGFGPVANIVANQGGFPRTMLWAPSGVYDKNRKNNFPPTFTLSWDDMPLLRTTHTRLRRIPDSGMQLGLWWGRATETTTEWDPASLEKLDLNNREHLRIVSKQIALAIDAGATLIGMDNLDHWIMPMWDQRRFIRALSRVYPKITFVAEPMCCDIVHADAPGFISAFTTPQGASEDLDFHRLKTPHYLADFLLPGHETWAYYRYSEITRSRVETISAARVQRDANHLARLGFVPVIVTTHTLTDPKSAAAQETWRTTVPKELQQNQKEVRAARGARPTDGRAPLRR